MKRTSLRDSFNSTKDPLSHVIKQYNTTYVVTANNIFRNINDSWHWNITVLLCHKITLSFCSKLYCHVPPVLLSLLWRTTLIFLFVGTNLQTADVRLQIVLQKYCIKTMPLTMKHKPSSVAICRCENGWFYNS